MSYATMCGGANWDYMFSTLTVGCKGISYILVRSEENWRGGGTHPARPPPPPRQPAVSSVPGQSPSFVCRSIVFSVFAVAVSSRVLPSVPSVGAVVPQPRALLLGLQLCRRDVNLTNSQRMNNASVSSQHLLTAHPPLDPIFISWWAVLSHCMLT